MKFKDYYDILGVKPDASADEIKSAYRRMARKFHPDVSKEKDAEERFKEVNEAYEALKDEPKRKAYDQLRARGYRPGEEFQPPPNFGDGMGGFEFGGDAGQFSDFFESLFGRAGGRPGAQGARPRAGADVRASLSIPLELAFNGGTERVTVNGKTLDVRIPAGIQTGKSIRLAGQGQAGRNGGGNGDLIIEIAIAPHSIFQLDGKDLTTRVNVMPWQAGLGASVAVPTMAGSVELKIPAGTSSGKKFRLRERGMPGKPPGDQFVVIDVQVPAASNEAQVAAYEKLRSTFETT